MAALKIIEKLNFLTLFINQNISVGFQEKVIKVNEKEYNNLGCICNKKDYNMVSVLLLCSLTRTNEEQSDPISLVLRYRPFNNP